jgi:hypothetical protein
MAMHLKGKLDSLEDIQINIKKQLSEMEENKKNLEKTVTSA